MCHAVCIINQIQSIKLYVELSHLNHHVESFTLISNIISNENLFSWLLLLRKIINKQVYMLSLNLDSNIYQLAAGKLQDNNFQNSSEFWQLSAFQFIVLLNHNSINSIFNKKFFSCSNLNFIDTLPQLFIFLLYKFLKESFKAGRKSSEKLFPYPSIFMQSFSP